MENLSRDLLFLKESMCDAARGVKFCEDLACARIPRRDAELLRGMAGEKERLLRRLQGEYFLLSGRSCCPCVAYIPIPRCYREALRLRWLADDTGARRCTAAAAQTDSPRLSALYGFMAAQLAAQASLLADLITGPED